MSRLTDDMIGCGVLAATWLAVLTVPTIIIFGACALIIKVLF